MSRRVSTLLVPLFLAVLSIIGLVLSFNIERSDVSDPSSPAFMPAVLSVIMLLCSIAIGWREFRSLPPSASSGSSAVQGEIVQAPDAGSQPEAEPSSAGDEPEEAEDPRKVYLNMGIFLVLLLVFAYLMSYVNFLVLSILFLFGSMVLLNPKKWKSALIVSVVTAAVIYFSFVYLFQVVFPN